MNDDLYSRLQGEAHDTDWDYLKAAHAQGTLIWVAQELDLIAVGVAVVTDDKAQVAAWLEAGHIGSFPDRLAIAQQQLKTLITAPYVLTQELLDD
jgi:hypothetical protein